MPLAPSRNRLPMGSPSSLSVRGNFDNFAEAGEYGMFRRTSWCVYVLVVALSSTASHSH
jgi:hypothetical protein